MAPPPLKKEPSHFEVLSLTPTSLDGQDAPTQTKTVKQAYRRALLKHHPDKNQQAKSQDAPSDPSVSSKSKKEGKGQHYTVDQITTAYTVLSDTRQRREYVRSLRTESRGSGAFTSSSSSSRANGSANQTYKFNFKSTPQQQSNQPQSSSGVETVDLDDVSWDGRKQVYHHTCGRCGTERGYCFRELDLEEVGEEGELMVQCTGCSLWLKVLFDEATEDEEEGEQDGNTRDVKSQRTGSQGGGDLKHTTSGSSTGKSGGWSWKFNFGISIGGGASASASAGRN